VKGGTRQRILGPICAACCAVLAATPALSQPTGGAAVDLELVLAVDASSSVNYGEFGLQMQGLAEAFRSPQVIQAIETAAPHGIAVAMLQWSGEDSQARAIDWHVIDAAASSRAFADAIDRTPRVVIGGATAIGTAIDAATRWLEDNAYRGTRQAIDVSGDGRSNQGTWTALARRRAVSLGIVVNGLAILNEEPHLDRYYLAAVVGGPGAFLITADDYDDFQRAIVRKLVNEIAGQPMVEAPGSGSARTALSRPLIPAKGDPVPHLPTSSRSLLSSVW
jgi:hypothetical protein